MVRKKKPLELFRTLRVKPRPSRYNGTILKKLAVFLKSVQVYRRQLGRRREEQRLRCMRSFGKAEWKLLYSGNVLWLANRRPPGKGHCRRPQGVLQAYRA